MPQRQASPQKSCDCPRLHRFGALHDPFCHFSSLIPPIRGKGFVWPLAAWTIPMMEKTNHTSARIPKMPEMISTAVELMSIWN